MTIRGEYSSFLLLFQRNDTAEEVPAGAAFIMPKVAILLPALLPFGGAERVQVVLAAEFAKRGIAVDFVFAWEKEDVSRWIPDRARVISLGVSRSREIVSPLAAYLKRERPDCILASMWPFTSLCVLANALAGFPSRVAVSEHSLLSLQHAHRGSPHKLALRGSLALSHRAADARIAVSDGVARDIAALSGIRREEISVIYNPVPAPRSEPKSLAEADGAWGGWTGPRIVSVGNLRPVKNHALLIRAFRRVLEHTDARLMIVGAGGMLDDTKRVAQHEGVLDRVIFTGGVSNTSPYYETANLFALSSDYEGFGVVVVEALFHGLPVVSTDCPAGPAEILENGKYGCLTPVGDAERLSSAMLQALSQKHDPRILRGRAAAFLPEAAASKYFALMFPQQDPYRNLQDCRM